jgi:predicted DNA-binding transcriptional regulator AlpA
MRFKLHLKAHLERIKDIPMVEQVKSPRIVSLDPLRGKDRILRIGAIRQRIDPPPSRATLYRWVKEGVIPEAFYLGGRMAWRESDIDAFIASLKPRDPAAVF